MTPYHLLEKNRTIIVVIKIALFISVIEFYLDIFVYHNSSILIFSDAILVMILTSVVCFYEYITRHPRLRMMLFSFIPLIFFPTTILGSSGQMEMAIMYFFLFSTIIIYINGNKAGMAVIVALLAEVIGFGLIEHFTFMELPDYSTRGAFDLMYLIHLAIVGIGNSYIFYNIVSRNNRLSDRLYKSTTRDYLTDTYNRRYIDSVLNDMHINKHKCDGAYLMFFDVDNFKAINDVHGHECGDDVLRIFADVVSHEIRSRDLFGRYGGDEFVLIVNEIDSDDAHKLKQRICDSFEKRCVEVIGVEVTISVGLESCENRKIKDIVRQADMSMYQEKKREKVEAVL